MPVVSYKNCREIQFYTKIKLRNNTIQTNYFAQEKVQIWRFSTASPSLIYNSETGGVCLRRI